MSEIKLRDIVKEGDVIRTKHNNHPAWVTNVILGIDANCIEIDIGMEKNYIDNIVIVGDTMKCKFTNDDREYTLLGWITKIKPDFPQKITIRIHNVEWFSNKRESYRYDVYLCAVIKQSKEDPKGLFAIMTNMSLNGCAFVTHENIEVAIKQSSDDDFVATKLYFEVFVSPEQQMSFGGEVVRKCSVEKGIEYGIHVTDIDYDNEKVMNELVNALEKKDKEIYNNRSSFWSKNSKYK